MLEAIADAGNWETPLFLWPVVLYALGLVVAWWPMRPKPDRGGSYAALVVVSMLQSLIYIAWYTSFLDAHPSMFWGRLTFEEQTAFGLVGMLLFGPAIGILGMVSAARSVICGITHLLLPFVAGLWMLLLLLIDDATRG